MTTQYEQLRYSFDNILKELDDICKGIDDISERVPESIDSGTVHTQSHKKSNKISNININGASYIEHSLSDLNADTEIYESVIGEEFSEFRDQRQDLETLTKSDQHEFLSFEQSSSFNSESLDKNEDDLNSNKLESEVVNITNNSDHVKKLNKRDIYKKHKLPDSDEASSVNSAIGSVQESVFNKLNLFPLETEFVDFNASKSSNNKNTEQIKLNIKIPDVTITRLKTSDSNSENGLKKILNTNKLGSSLLSLKPFSQTIHSQVSFQIEDDAVEFENPSFDRDRQEDFLNDENFQNPNSTNYTSSEAYNSQFDDNGDYLSDQEITKIKCFYNSMGCYVYVNRSIAELYQMKRGDAFDEIDNDPVNDYKLYMESLENQNSNVIDEETARAELEEKRCNVNYMYINSGVPVIVFNYGADPKRSKDMRILLVERSTGFCMWQFKFDWLTHFENSNNITVVRLAFSNKSVNNKATVSSSGSNNNVSESGILSSISSKLSTLNQSNAPNYQNKYFEKFFSCTKIVHKEHLLKFVDKNDCDQFCSRQTNIIKKSPDEFTLSYDKENYSDLSFWDANNELLPSPPSPITTSNSLIICHFDNYNNKDSSDTFDRNPERKYDTLSHSLNEISFNEDANFLTNKFNEEQNDSKLSTIRTNLLRKYSISTTNVTNIPNSNSIGAIIKRKLFGSNSSIDDLKKRILKEPKQQQQLHQPLTNLNLLKFKFKKLKKSDISGPVNFQHLTHIDQPVPIGRRYKLNYKS